MWPLFLPVDNFRPNALSFLAFDLMDLVKLESSSSSSSAEEDVIVDDIVDVEKDGWLSWLSGWAMEEW